MDGDALEELLARILSPDNVLRAAAERELDRRCSSVPGFCTALAAFCESVVAAPSHRALALVAFAVLKRGLGRSVFYREVHEVVGRFAGRLSGIATAGGITVAALRQWTAVIVSGVRRLAVLRVSFAAAQEREAAQVAAACDAVSESITSQLLSSLAMLAQQPDAACSRSAYCHLLLLQDLFEEPVPEVTQLFCGDLVVSCVEPLLELLCSLAHAATAVGGGASTSAASALFADDFRMTCALQSTAAQTLGVLFEWQFAASRNGKFPLDVKRPFLDAFPALQAFLFAPCVQWLSAASSSAAALPNSAAAAATLHDALPRAAPLIAAAAQSQELIVKVLQYGGWYKRCATPALLQALLGSLDADRSCYAAVLAAADGDDDDGSGGGGTAHVGPSGSSADAWVGLDSPRRSDAVSLAEAAVLVRRHVTQRWTLFRDVALLPFLKSGFVDVVGDQCGRPYYQLLLSYAALAPAEAEAWADDPNTFLRDEDDRDDGLRWTARDTVAQLYTDSIVALGPLFLHSSLEDLHERLFAAGQDALLPFEREAGLFFMEMALRRCARRLRECGAADFTPLAAHVWAYDVAGPTGHPATTPRALMLLTAVVTFMSDAPAAPMAALLGTIVAESTAVLGAFAGATAPPAGPVSRCSPLVAVLLCRVLQSTLPHWPPPLLEQHFTAVATSLLLLLSPTFALSEEVLYATVEQLTDFLRAAQLAVGQRGRTPAPSLIPPALPRLVMACWRRHVSDPSFADVVLPLLHRVVRDTAREGSAGATAPALLEELAWVNNVLCGYAESMAEVCAVPYFLRLLRAIFASGSDALANGAASLMLDSLCQLLLCTHESAVLVASSSCLAALLRRCPAAQSVQVRVVAASMDAALSGPAGAPENDGPEHGAQLAADAPRVVYPFSTVVVAIVLRTLQDARGEAALLEMGQTLVTMMQQSTSFTEADLVRVIHATVHRLAVVRTDTVRQQLLAPLATLLQLHPAALMRTLVQGGMLAETMRHWLPSVEHFADLRVTFASCQSLLEMLALLSEPAAASVAAGGDGERVAQQTVTCRWRLPRDVAGNAAAASEQGVQRTGQRGGAQKATQKRKKTAKGGKAFSSSRAEEAIIETSLPLYAATLVAVGRGFLTLMGAPASALHRAIQPATTAAAAGSGAADDDGDSDGEDGADGAAGGGRRLFAESDGSDDGEDEEEEEWHDSEESGDESAGEDAARCGAEAAVSGQEAPSTASMLAPMGAQLCSWMHKYGSELTPYFTTEETQRLMAFFAAVTSGGAAQVQERNT